MLFRHLIRLTATLFILLPVSALASDVNISGVPNWVESIEFDQKLAPSGDKANGGTFYLLADLQTNYIKGQKFRHFAIKVTNSSGVQEASDISTEFDPAFQTLDFHFVRIHRAGEVIAKLTPESIRTFQREESMERSLFDGSVTAVVIVPDMRRGDIVEYAYTVSGFNPVHAGHRHTDMYLQYGIPAGELYVRMVSSPTDPPEHHLFHDAPEPERRTTVHGDERIWRLLNLAASPFFDSSPVWYDPSPRITVSSYGTWSKVVNWALPLYQISEAELEALQRLGGEHVAGDTEDARIANALRFVQDDVRYLGFMGGLGGYQPNPPATVLDRRYGDCKDKAILLVGLLRSAGVEAYPMLVNTVGEQAVLRALPSPVAFDHCITAVRRGTDWQFVDPTLSYQGGDLDHLANLPYGTGLIIADDVVALETIPDPEVPGLVIDVQLDLRDTTRVVTMTIETTYSGSEANVIRQYLASTSLNSQYLSYGKFYNELYGSIDEPDTIYVINDDRFGANTVQVYESYTVTDFWEADPDEPTVMYAEFFPMEIDDYLEQPGTQNEDAPYALSGPIDVVQTVHIISHENWPMQLVPLKIEGEGYLYESKFVTEGELKLIYHYHRTLNYVPAEQVPQFLADHETMYEDTGFNLTDGGADAANMMPILVFIMIGVIGLGAWLAIWWYRRFDRQKAA